LHFCFPDAIAALKALNQPIVRAESSEEVNLIRLINYRLPIVQRQRLQVLGDGDRAQINTNSPKSVNTMVISRWTDLTIAQLQALQAQL
jgi:hypothetical protein